MHEIQNQAKYLCKKTSGIWLHSDFKYFLRSNLEPKNMHYKRLSNTRIIKKLLLEFSKCFQSPTLQYKQKDLNDLADLLD